MYQDLPGFDPFSYLLGYTECFCEMVQAGVKRLALSPPMSREHAARMEGLLPQLTGHYGIRFYREDEMLRSTLAPDSALEGKVVFLLFRDGDVLPAYLELKQREGRYLRQGGYSQQQREELSRELCALLSYPQAR